MTNTPFLGNAQALTPDAAKIERALAERFEDAGRDYVQLVTIHIACQDRRCVKKGTCQTHAKTFAADEFDDAVEWACEENGKGANVYVSWASPKYGLEKKASKKELALIHGQHFDYDPPKREMTAKEREEWKDSAWSHITKELPEGVPDNFEIIDSGGGFNLLWPFHDPLPATPENILQIEIVNRQIAAAFGADGASEWNADRILRLAGTINWPTGTKLKRGRIPALAKLEETATKTFSVKSFRHLPELSRAGKEATRTGGKNYARLDYTNEWVPLVYEDVVEAYPRAGEWQEIPEKDGSENLASFLWTWIHAMCRAKDKRVSDMDCQDARLNLYKLADEELRYGTEQRFPDIHAHLLKEEGRGWEGKLSLDVDRAFQDTKREGVGPTQEMRRDRGRSVLDTINALAGTVADRLPALLREIADARLSAADEERCIEALAAKPGAASPTALKKDLTTEKQNLRKLAKEHQKAELANDAVDAGDATELSEEWFALRFADRHKGRLRYVAVNSQWVEWTGTHWQEENTLNVYDLIRADIRAAARKLGSDDEGLARILNSQATRAAVEKLAKSDRRLVATHEQWDKDAWLLNTAGGVVDLRTGDLMTHDPTFYMSKITAVAPGGECPLWLKFLARVTDGDKALQRYMQKFVGYCLSGDVQEHLLHFLFGSGRNGKGVFVNTISGVLGDYARAAAMDTFVERRHASHPTELAHLKGARFVTVPEIEEGVSWNESRVKALTGGDPVTARYMRGDFFTYEPTFKIAIVGNHKPRIKNVDVAITERMRLVPFSVTIPTSERDPDLMDKLRDEWPGILQWAIEGASAYRVDGLVAPEAVKLATDGYLQSQNTHAQWFSERCSNDATKYELLKDLFADWADYAARNHIFPGNNIQFGARMDAMGFERIEKRHLPAFVGVALNSRIIGR